MPGADGAVKLQRGQRPVQRAQSDMVQDPHLLQAGSQPMAHQWGAQFHNIVRLEQDHQHAIQLSHTLRDKFGKDEIACATNMIHLSLPGDVYSQLQQHLKEQGIRVGRPRWVMHLDIDDDAVEQIEDAVKTF